LGETSATALRLKQRKGGRPNGQGPESHRPERNT
jgi:hypothetical protein